MDLISAYKTIDPYRLSFNGLARQTFGVDFEKWYQNGCWNDRYLCYSFRDKDEIVANVSVNKLNLVIGGQEYPTIQLGTVMTRPGYRGRGLARQLMETVLKEYERECAFFFLFANESVTAFYPKFGFQTLKYGLCYEAAMKTNHQPHRKLDISRREDFNILQRVIRGRVPPSTVFSVTNAESITLWYCLYEFENDLYYLDEGDAVVIYRREGDTLHLYDCICGRELSLIDILQTVGNPGINKTALYFTPTKEDLNYLQASIARQRDGELFVRPVSTLIPQEFVYPITAHA